MFILHLVFFLCSFLLYLMQVLVVYCFVAPGVPTFFLFLFFLCERAKLWAYICIDEEEKRYVVSRSFFITVTPLQDRNACCFQKQTDKYICV